MSISGSHFHHSFNRTYHVPSNEVLEERIATRIAKATDILHKCSHLIPQIVTAGQQLTDCILNDGKILVLGNGSTAFIGQIFTAHLMYRFERDRPGLPAISLNADVTMISSLGDESHSEHYSRQIKALGKTGDCLLVISTTGTYASLMQAVSAAHELDLLVIALTGSGGSEISTLLNFGDIEIRVDSDYPPTVREHHLMLIHCLNELIDLQIFG
ncbi:MAG: phosphoheptose isomerase [Gammaproteobacteria bacterium]|nr:phosphoheptose isomerase [Gammaproteobacteria bacterium]